MLTFFANAYNSSNLCSKLIKSKLVKICVNCSNTLNNSRTMQISLNLCKQNLPSNWYWMMLLNISRRKKTRWWFVGEEKRNQGVLKASSKCSSLVLATILKVFKYGDTEKKSKRNYKLFTTSRGSSMSTHLLVQLAGFYLRRLTRLQPILETANLILS